MNAPQAIRQSRDPRRRFSIRRNSEEQILYRRRSIKRD